MSIVVLFCPVAYQTEKRIRAQEAAIKTLAAAPRNVIPLALGFRGDPIHPLVQSLNIQYLDILKRDPAILIGRRLPYIKEILDVGAKLDCEKFGYINSDILIHPDTLAEMEQNRKPDVFLLSRFEIAEISSNDFLRHKQVVFIGGDKHQGVDGFIFKKSWWIDNRSKFSSDLLIAATEWDTYYRFLVKKLTDNYIETRVLYHVLHTQSWSTTTPDALNNIAIWNKIRNSP